MLQTILKLAVSVAIILACTAIARRLPSAAGLLATMPLTSLIVLVWIWGEHRGQNTLLADYARGAMWGIVPTIGFYAAAMYGFRRQWPLYAVLAVGFAVWGVGAWCHQRWLR